MGSGESTSAKIDGHDKQTKTAVHDGTTKHVKPLLNARQRDILRKSWKRSTGSDSVGARIFRKIFTTEPAIARIFGLDGVALQDLTHNPQFKVHADRFTKTLTFFISNLDNKEKISQYAQALGARHVKFESLGFKTAYWDTFADAMTECAIDWEGGVRCREAMQAWRVLVAFFIEEMRIGYRQERSKNSGNPTLSHNGATSGSALID